jgi:hypothetical protein
MFFRFKFLIDKNIKYISILSLNIHVFTKTYFNLPEKLSDGYNVHVAEV